MSPELKGPVRLLAAEAVIAAAVAVGSWVDATAGVALALSIPLVILTALTLVTLFKRLAEQNIAQMPSRLLRAACWVAFFVAGLPLALWLAFMACCAPTFYLHS